MLLITDLDNTLYDWVTYFATSFKAMLLSLRDLLGVDEEQLAREFKELHQRYGTSEQPFVVLELPSVRARFEGLSREALLDELDAPLHAFNRARRETLHLYPGVQETLVALAAAGVTIVGHTEAVLANSFYRLQMLGIDHFFTRLYVPAHSWSGHPRPERDAALQPPIGLVRQVPKAERKPNPRLLREICFREGVTPSSAMYVGDSIIRDIGMAKAAGVPAAWARYGTEYDHGAWSLLVRITHWTDEDVQREAELKRRSHDITPDYTLDSFRDLLEIVGVDDGGLARPSR